MLEGRQLALATQEQTSPHISTDDTLSLTDIAHILSNELKLRREQVLNTVTLLDEQNTIPFIARYRKEMTGSLDEVQIQAIADRTAMLRALYERKADVCRLIDEQGKLTPELSNAITSAATHTTS